MAGSNGPNLDELAKDVIVRMLSTIDKGYIVSAAVMASPDENNSWRHRRAAHGELGKGMRREPDAVLLEAPKRTHKNPAKLDKSEFTVWFRREAEETPPLRVADLRSHTVAHNAASTHLERFLGRFHPLQPVKELYVA